MPKAMVELPAGKSRTQAPGPKLTEVAWLAGRQLSLRQWIESGQRLGTVGRGIGWWIGDWLAFGNAQYGEKYSRASRITGYDPQTLMNMVYVASRFETGRRRRELSWSHHAELAALDVQEQEHWLDFAANQSLSVRSLRAELRSVQHQVLDPPEIGDHGGQDPSAPLRMDTTILCPHCQHRIAVDR